MTTLSESTHAAEFMVSEAEGTRSREAITLLSGQNLKAGAVLGKVTLGAASAAAAAGNTGNGAMGAITVSAGAKAGAYQLVIIEPATDAGKFTVEDPDGIVIGTGAVAAAYSAGGLAFTLADGGTDFVAGDRIVITVAAGSGKYKEYNPGNADGSQTPAGVLRDAVDASAADAPGVAYLRDCEVNGAELQWFSGATDNQKATGKAGLATLGIISR